ncbi:phage baseplate protein [Anaerofustis stercorihominis]|uniref:phage baseplate protein n=1 Tax=Anaerofustis stercorihominis TaxID=214853 RepID=UPI00214D066C|nr:hypothetical protein [Anaerofustis stercorihominis]MCR2033252.1 hypothetical protein [Anaerofustis stercorihominis]
MKNDKENINELEEENEDIILIGYDGDDIKGSIDSLSSRSSYYPLSANQGRVLNAKVDGFLDNINNLENKIGTLLDIFYPIGSIYQSTKSIDPNNVIGGTWQKIEGRFLFASSSTYSIGNEGGSDKNILIANNIPLLSVNTKINETTLKGAFGNFATQSSGQGPSASGICSSYMDGDYGGYGTSKKGLKDAIRIDATHSHTATATAGNSSPQAINNMPPYKVINMWERIG